MKKIKGYIKNDLYKIKINNVLVICVLVIFLIILYFSLRLFLTEIFNIHLGLNFRIDFLPIYSVVISLMIPLAILLIEKISNNHDSIIAEAYLKSTYIFPIIIYYCSTLVSFTFLNDQYYFVFSIIVSIVLMIYMYFQSLKLLSRPIYETKRIKDTIYNLIKKDIVVKKSNYGKDNKILEYSRYGILINRFDYLSTEGYYRISIKSQKDYSVINGYNYKMINKILEILEKANKEYIENVNREEKDVIKKPNIILYLKSMGDVLSKSKDYATLYYKNIDIDAIKKLVNLIDNRIYNLTEEPDEANIQDYVKGIVKRCIVAINNDSSLLLEDTLKEYKVIYEQYVDLLKKEIGDYTYELAYQQLHTIYSPTIYNVLKWIRNDIHHYCHMIKRKNDFTLLNTLISFLYELILYSSKNEELLSIQYLNGLYEILNDAASELNVDYSLDKIKLEQFEIIDVVLYSFNDNSKNLQFLADVLLIYNKTIVNITYKMFSENYNMYEIYIIKLSRFINKIKEKLIELKNGTDEKVLEQKGHLTTILEHYESNVFAMHAYLLKYLEKNQNKNMTDSKTILDYYKSINSSELTLIYLKTMWLDFNDHTYNWDGWEHKDLDRIDGMWSVNTSDYLTNLYCSCLLEKNINSIKLPSSRDLLDKYEGYIKKILLNLNREDLIKKFEIMKETVDEQEKQYLRDNYISSKKVEEFKNKFFEYYESMSKLFLLMKKYNNFEIVKKINQGNNFLATGTVIDKTYFLESMPNDRNIIFLDFESGFANSFIRSENIKYLNILNKKSINIETNISNYILDNLSDRINDFIIIGNYQFDYQIEDIDKIKYSLLPEEKSIDNKADKYFVINNTNIPVYEIYELKDWYYLVNVKKMGKFQKKKNCFDIDVIDYSNNQPKLEEAINKNIRGIELVGEEKKQYLLECVNILIKEYVYFEIDDIEIYKFKYISND